MNLRLRYLRESEAYYRWLLAAAVNERLFQDQEEGDLDSDLFSRSVGAAKNPVFFPIIRQIAIRKA